MISKTQFGKMSVWAVLVALAVLCLFAALFVLKGKDNKKDNGSDTVAGGYENALSAEMHPVESGDYVYRFEGINWTFEPAGEARPGVPRTKVNMMFEKFSRIENRYIDFGNPYKFGIYEGECREVESIALNKEVETGIALSFSECISPEAKTEFAIFQEGKDVVVKNRTVSAGDSPYAPLDLLWKIDLTEVAR